MQLAGKVAIVTGAGRGIAKVSLRRIGDCETDIGAAVVFLASSAAGYITGQTLMVDCGQTKAF